MKQMSVATIKTRVRIRDGHACVDCGKTSAETIVEYGEQLDVHRLVPGSTYTINGCVSLCKECHKERHRATMKPKSPKKNAWTSSVSDWCVYAPLKVDAKVLEIAREAANLEGKPLQDWLSDEMNSIASNALGLKPVIRKHRRPAGRPNRSIP